MKKVFAILLMLCLMTAAACATPAPVHNFAGAFETWEQYECAVYNLERYYYPEEDLPQSTAGLTEDEDGKQRLLIGQGTMTHTIEVLDGETFSLIWETEFTYIDEGVYTQENLGDEYQRFLRFMSAGDKTFFSKTDTLITVINISTTENNPFEPVYVEKSVDQQSTGDNLWFSYDYGTKKLKSDFNGDKAERKINISGVYDSEQLLLFFRLLSPDYFKAGSALSISNIVNFTDAVVYGGNPQRLSFSGVSESQTVTVKNPQFADDLEREEEDFTAIKVTVQNTSESKKGAPITAYYNVGILGKGNNTSNRILLKARQISYDTKNASNTLATATEYNIVSLNYVAPGQD